MDAHPPEPASYQERLRCLGARLDEQHVGRYSIIETPDGFTVFFQRRLDDLAVQCTEVTNQSLAEDAARRRWLRKILGSAYHPESGLFPTGHQDFLHALGFELDDAEGKNILIDQQDDVLTLTYSSLDPGEGYVYRKHLLALGRPEIAEILKHAYARRKRRLLRHSR